MSAHPTPATMAEQLRRSRSGAPDRGERAEQIGAAVTALPDIAGLTAGPHMHVVTYRVGSPYAGVAIRDEEIDVSVVARRGRPLVEVASAVRKAVTPLSGGLPVNVLIADVDG